MCCFEGVDEIRCSWWRKTGKQKSRGGTETLGDKHWGLLCVAETWGHEGLCWDRKGGAGRRRAHLSPVTLSTHILIPSP